jgi:uncharacterized protein with PIN domain
MTLRHCRNRAVILGFIERILNLTGGYMARMVAAKGNRKCPKCGGRLKDVTEDEEGIRIFECQVCSETYEQGEVSG